MTRGKIKHIMALKKNTRTIRFFFSFQFPTSRSAFSLSPISPPTKHRNLPETKSHKHKTNRSRRLSGGDSLWPLLENDALKQRLRATTSGSVVRKFGRHVAAREMEHGDRIPGFCISEGG